MKLQKYVVDWFDQIHSYRANFKSRNAYDEEDEYQSRKRKRFEEESEKYKAGMS